MTPIVPPPSPHAPFVALDPAALAKNYQTCAAFSGAASTAAVVKADGYGLGAKQVAQVLEAAGADQFFVAHLAEAITIRPHIGTNARIYVLGGLAETEIPAYRAHNIIPVLNNSAQMALWANQAANLPCTIHLDTGLARLGLAPTNWASAATDAGKLNIALIMSHLANSSGPADAQNAIQLAKFKEGLALFPPAPASLAASGGIFLGADYHFDLTRPGIALYGSSPFDAGITHLPNGKPVPMLEPVASLYAPILQVRTIEEGQSVGYGGTYVAKKRRQIATVSLGYADGYLRAGSGKGFAVIGGAICPIVGRVSMDLITLDVSEISEVRAGQWAMFFGRAAPIDAQAEAQGTIGYELLTRMGNRISRVWQSA